MSNYSAIVTTITNIRPHSNADRLACTNLYGNNVIIGKDTKIGDVGLFFPLESQLGFEFAQVNDLIRRKDENGNPVGGMFGENRRVRAQKFRGENSMGFWCPLSYLYKLENINPSDFDLQEGEEIETLAGYEISKKYVVKRKSNDSKSRQGKKDKKESRILPDQFKFHFDTAQLGRNLHKIEPESLIALTWKMHGTSAIVSNILCKKELNPLEKFLRWCGINIVDTEYDYVYSSRRVIKNEGKNYQHFYDSDIWTLVGETFRGRLHKGETIYYEISGYTPEGQAIQKGFDYGCGVGEYKVYIYRITQTNADGIVTELPWHQVKHRANEIGYETVPEIYYGKAAFAIEDEVKENFGEQFLQEIGEVYVYDQRSKFCKNNVPEEGVVVRIENGDGIACLKYKSFAFYQYESKQLDKDEVDMESQNDETD